MRRYVDTFFRYIGLFIIPMLIGPVVVSAVLLSSVTYTSTAALWVEQPLYGGDQTAATEGSTWDSPSKQIATLLTELMSTRDFLTSVLDSTSLKNTAKTEEDRLALMENINKKVKIQADGWRLINLSYTDSKAKISLEVLDATVTKLKTYYDARMARQGEGAATYYQNLLNAAQETLDQTNNDLLKFLNDHPNQIGSEGATKAVRPEDVEFSTLTQNRDAARKRYDDIKATLEKIQMSYGAYLQGQGTTLRVQDKPMVFNGSVSSLRQILMGSGIGLLVGLVIAIAATVVLTLLDRTVRLPMHTAQVLRVGRVLELPNVDPNRGWKKSYSAQRLLQLDQARLLPGQTDDKKTSNKAPKAKARFVLRRSIGLELHSSESEVEQNLGETTK